MPANPKYEKPDEFGRKPETWPPIPFNNGQRIPGHVTDAIAEWLKDRRGSKRGAPIGAALLALICALHKEGHYLPTRQRLADALGTGTPSVDAALSTSLGHDEIRELLSTEDGEVDGRASVRRHRYIKPGKRLLAVYDAAMASRNSTGFRVS